MSTMTKDTDTIKDWLGPDPDDPEATVIMDAPEPEPEKRSRNTKPEPDPEAAIIEEVNAADSLLDATRQVIDLREQLADAVAAEEAAHLAADQASERVLSLRSALAAATMRTKAML